jgi:hypothetical protein
MTYDRDRQRVAEQMALEQRRRGGTGPMGNGPVVGRPAMQPAPAVNVPRTLAATNIAARETLFPSDSPLADGPMPSGFEVADDSEEAPSLNGLPPSSVPDDRPPAPAPRTDVPTAAERDAVDASVLQQAMGGRDRPPRPQVGDPNNLNDPQNVVPRGMRTLAATNIAARESLFTEAPGRRAPAPSGFEPAD